MARFKIFSFVLALLFLSSVKIWAEDGGKKDLAGLLSTAKLSYKEAWQKSCEPIRQNNSFAWPNNSEAMAVYALCFSPETQTYFSNQNLALLELERSKAPARPSLSASANIARNFNNRNDLSSPNTSAGAGLSFDYKLYDFGGQQGLVQAAEANSKAADSLVESNLQGLLWNAVNTYYQYKLAIASYYAFKDSEQTSRENLKSVESRYSVGLATPADKTQAETALAKAVLETTKARSAIYTQALTLQSYFGAIGYHDLNPNSDVSQILSDSTANNLSAPSNFKQQFQKTLLEEERKPNALVLAVEQAKLEDLFKLAQRYRAEIQAANYQIESAKAFYESEKSVAYPSLNFNASANWRRQEYDNKGSSLNTPNNRNGTSDQSVGLNLTVPLYDGNQAGARKEIAQEKLFSSTSNRAQVEKQVFSEMSTAFYNQKSSKATIFSSKALLDSAEESLRVTQGRYEAGLSNLVDVFNAISALANAQQQYSSAIFNYELAKIQLLKTIGLLNLDNLKNLSLY